MLTYLQPILQSIPLPALLIDQNEMIQVQNDRATALLGADGTGRHYFTQLRQPAVLVPIEETLQGKGPQQGRFIGRTDGVDRAFHVTIEPFDHDGASVCMVTFEDITALETANKMRTGFVANASHELRTPLTSLLGFVETLQGPAKNDPIAQEKFLNIMHKEASRMNRLIDDILSLSKLEADERLRPEDIVNLPDILQTVVNANKLIAKDAGVTLNVSQDGGEMKILGDPDQVTQVLTNLIGNAIKYGASGQKVDIDITYQDRNPFLRAAAVVVTVRDYGAGFDPVHIPRLTERFYRVDSHRSRDLGGTGLGLAIVKHIMNRHRGRLRIESAEGQGASFMAIFPASANTV